MTAAIYDVKPIGSVVVVADDLGGVAEVAELLGVSKQRVTQLAKGAGFPQPLAQLAAGPVWDMVDVRTWAERSGRL